MFETVAPRAPSRRVAYETLPISIGLHAVGVAGAVVIAVWNVVFPTQSPHAIRAYVLVTSLEPPLPAAVKLAAPTPAKAALLTNLPQFNPNIVVAPNIIPDTIPLLPETRSASIFAPVIAPENATGETPGGSSDGIAGGALHGVGGGMPVSEDGRVHFGRDKPLPLFVVHRVYPDYPEQERLMGKEATVVVRYIIGIDGWVKELNILQHAQQASFDEATLKALREWRFQPLLQDGKPIEVVHELTVFFELVYR
jgi:TonB family protein